MTVMTEKTAAEPLKVVEVDGSEILAEFTRIMLEWGHYKTAAGLRYPLPDEARESGAGRRTDRGWNKDPIPYGRPLFVAHQVRPVPPADCEGERAGGRRPAVRAVLHRPGPERGGVVV